jgi:hypothetical protein
MKRDSITILWFTGLISQYDITKCDIENLKINHNLLDKIQERYKADKFIALVNIRNDIEKQQYTNLINKEGLANKLIFVFCDMSDTLYNTLLNIIGTLRYSYSINYYIDCSRRRLMGLLEMVEQDKLIHISQLLD